MMYSSYSSRDCDRQYSSGPIHLSNRLHNNGLRINMEGTMTKNFSSSSDLVTGTKRLLNMLFAKLKNHKHKRRSTVKKLILIASLSIFISSFQSQSPHRSLASSTIRRILCLDGESTPYITLTPETAHSRAQVKSVIATMDSPSIPGRRHPPTHIILCEEFLKRRDVSDGKPQPAEQYGGRFHVTEDDAVCRDWSTPNLSLMEIFSAQIIGRVSQHYHVTYEHNCNKDNAPDVDESQDGYDWTTIQETLLPSGLVLDDNLISEEDVVGRCRKCMSDFNQRAKEYEQEKGDEDDLDPNPYWFDPSATHHCILYPETERPIVNEAHETDLVALTEARAMAQNVLYNKILATMKDRLRTSAVLFKLGHGDPPITTISDSGESITTAGRLLFGDQELKRRQRILEEEAVDPGTNVEETNGAVIYFDEGSLPLKPLSSYAKYIPSTVTTIDVLVSPLCSTVHLGDQLCIDHAADLVAYFIEMYPNAVVQLDIVMSTAAVFSRMELAKYLVCPPGTTACLMPALAKEEDTFAVVAESPDSPKTYQYFNFVDTHDDHLQLAQVVSSTDLRQTEDAITTTGFMDVDGDLAPVLEESPTGNKIFTLDSNPAITSVEADATSDENVAADPEGDARTTSGGGLDMDSFLSPEHRDGCVELRGKLGSWELDYSYSDLKQEDSAPMLRGQSNVDVAEDRFGTNNEEAGTVEGRFSAWSEDVNPECALDLLNLNGLCEVVSVMQLGVIQFVGDRYTEEQVKSFWELLGLYDPNDPNSDIGKIALEDGESPPNQYRKTAHCPKEGYAFDILFTPNEHLIHTVEVSTPIGTEPENRYVPVPDTGDVVNNYFYDNSVTNNDYSQDTSTSTTTTESRTNTDTRTTENFSRTSENNQGAN